MFANVPVAVILRAHHNRYDPRLTVIFLLLHEYGNTIITDEVPFSAALIVGHVDL